MNPKPPDVTRRAVVAGLGTLALAPRLLQAADGGFPPPEQAIPAIAELIKGKPIPRSRVKIEIPRIADNGNAVPCRIVVNSPQTADDHVKTIHLFSEKNPRPVMARFHLGAASPRAEVSTRVRLAGTQLVVAVAEMGNGSFHCDIADVLVTVSACVDGT